jgi:hypothetical protein
MRVAATSIAALLLSACATTYQPQSFSGGFAETQLDKNVFRVSFKGNGYTSRDRVEDFTLLRSAELTLKNGFTHFVIVDGRSGTDYSTMTMPTQSTTVGSASVYGNTAYGRATTTTTGGQSFVIQKPSSTNTIFCINGKPEGVFAYDAAFIMRSLTEKYGLQSAK